MRYTGPDKNGKFGQPLPFVICNSKFVHMNNDNVFPLWKMVYFSACEVWTVVHPTLRQLVNSIQLRQATFH